MSTQREAIDYVKVQHYLNQHEREDQRTAVFNALFDFFGLVGFSAVIDRALEEKRRVTLEEFLPLMQNIPFETQYVLAFGEVPGIDHFVVSEEARIRAVIAALIRRSPLTDAERDELFQPIKGATY